MKLHRIKRYLWLVAMSFALAANGALTVTPGGGGSGGTGGVLTNNTVAAVIANFYTNSTPHWIDGEARLGTSLAGRIQAAVTNSDNTLFFHYQSEVAVVGATSNTISFKVPPGGWWKFSGLTTTATDGSQQLLYVATNGSVSFATSAGNAATVTDGVTQSGLAAGSYAINGALATNFNYSALNIGDTPQHINPFLRNSATAFQQKRPFRIIEFGDDQVGSSFGTYLGYILTNSFRSQVSPLLGNGGFMYRNTAGGATNNSATTAGAAGLLPVATLYLPNGGSSTNVSTTESGWAANCISLNYYQGVNGSIVVRTNAYGSAAATMATVSATNGTFQLAYTNWFVPIVNNMVVSIYSIGTNVVAGFSGFDTNTGVSSYSMDRISDGDYRVNYFTSSATTSNSSITLFSSNQWDLVITHDVDGTSTALVSNEWFIVQNNFERMLTNTSSRADIVHIAPTPNIPDPGFAEAQRDGMRNASIIWNRTMFDSPRLFANTNRSGALGFYQSDGVHLSTTGGIYFASQFAKDLGLTPDAVAAFGITLGQQQRTNATDYTSLRIQSGNVTSIITNGFGSLNRHVWGYNSASPSDWGFMVGSGISGIRGTSTTYLMGADKTDGYGGQYGFFTGGTSGGGLVLHPASGGGIAGNEPGPGGITMNGGLTNYNTTVTKTHFYGGVTVGSTPVTISTGSGTPEGVVAAPVGSLFLRNDGSTSTTLYVKTSGSGNTGWTAK